MASKTKPPADPLLQLADNLLNGGRKSVDEIRRAMLDMLSPVSEYERRRAREIADMEVELEQHRRMRDAHLVSKTQELAAGLFATGIIQVIPRNEHPEEQAKARDLFSENLDKQNAALDAMASYSIDPVALHAEAYHILAEPLGHHEARIASLEKRRRELLEDYETLRVIAPRVRRHA
ncbi:hypothetical protein [Roseivivax lentus]|uniref:hypothetical protein n=1 Tax=Roseivivax lentus TaxID=633194 RepID=UPI00097133B2|nr:hypothetical protein [Roseivivax lentus]